MSGSTSNTITTSIISWFVQMLLQLYCVLTHTVMCVYMSHICSNQCTLCRAVYKVSVLSFMHHGPAHNFVLLYMDDDMNWFAAVFSTHPRPAAAGSAGYF